MSEFFPDDTECVTVHLVSASPDKLGNLFTVPVNREEDAELIWLIARVLDATATDLIYLLHGMGGVAQMHSG